MVVYMTSYETLDVGSHKIVIIIKDANLSIFIINQLNHTGHQGFIR